MDGLGNGRSSLSVEPQSPSIFPWQPVPAPVLTFPGTIPGLGGSQEPEGLGYVLFPPGTGKKGNFAPCRASKQVQSWGDAQNVRGIQNLSDLDGILRQYFKKSKLMQKN